MVDTPKTLRRAQSRGGSQDEPADKVGLVEIYGQAWRAGGSKQRTGEVTLVA